MSDTPPLDKHCNERVTKRLSLSKITDQRFFSMARNEKKFVLIVSSQIALSREISKTLSDHFEIISVRDPNRATELLTNDRPVCAAMVHLASGDVALTLLQNLRRAHPTVRRIALADEGDLAGMIEGLHSGAIEHLLHTPFDARALLAALIARPASKPARRSA